MTDETTSELKMQRPKEGRNELRGSMGDDHNGLNLFQRGRTRLRVICSNGGGWEHVSVSAERATPTWEEMEYIKNKYWPDGDATVVQIHPPKDKHINNHKFCLHLWRNLTSEFVLPPPEFV